MPNSKKKIMIKTPKTASANPVSSSKMEGYVPKGLTKDVIKKINDTTDFNKNRIDVETKAKSDSVSSAKKAKFNGKDLVDQRREGNKTANETREGGGVPKVARGRYTNTNPDKYHTGGYSSLTSDSYSRTAPVEKDMPVIKKVLVKKEKKG